VNAQAREKSKCSLAAELLQSRGMLQLRAQGTSMLPTVWPGDFLTIEPQTSKQIQAGDIALYVREGRFFVHRIVDKSSVGSQVFLIARGDCMSQQDPPIRETELLGRVTEIRRNGSPRVPTPELPPFHRFLACMLCHWSFFRRVVLYLRACRTDSDPHLKVAVGETAW
jgi:hypothetical protein